MKLPKSKNQIRKELAAEVEAYLHAGGAVKSIPPGISGNESNLNIFSQRSNFEPKQDRTPLNEVVMTLESRKASKNKKPVQKSRVKKPQKKMLTDDFGEPLRWIWDE